MKKYIVAIETTQYIEIEAANEGAAIDLVKKNLDPKVANAADFKIAQEIAFDAESNTYKPL